MGYSIDITMTPHTWDNAKEPYFWIIYANRENGNTNEGCGWAVSTEQAWKDANDKFSMLMKKD